MICPYCGADDDKVIDSRASEAGKVIRRRRECLECEKRFTTYERIERTARIMVIKKDGSRVAFNPENILQGIQAACGKRPISEDRKFAIVEQIEEEIYRDFDREVPSGEIGTRVMRKLLEVDRVAYIRYASQYHNFESLDEFAAEVSQLQARPQNLPNQQPLFEGE